MTAPAESPGPHAKKPELRALTGLRAVAAIAVVLSHTEIPHSAPQALRNIPAWGHVGVPLFFLLSGFVLAYNYSDLSFTNARKTALFYIARIARVMPLYWLMILYCYLVLYVQQRPQHIDALWKNIFAVQTWSSDLATAQAYYNGPGWSIGVEMFFYLLFPLLAPLLAIIVKRWNISGLLVVLAVCFAASWALWFFFVSTGRASLPATDPSSAHRWLYRNPLPHLTEFIAGMALAHLVSNLRPLPARTHHIVQAVTVVFVMALAAFRPLGHPAFSAGSFSAFLIIPFALIVFSLASGTGWLAHILATRPMVALGAASYALYITHRWLVWQLASAQDIPDAPGWQGWAGLLVTLVVLLAIAEGAHQYVEKPARSGIMRLARSLFGSARATPRHAPQPERARV